MGSFSETTLDCIEKQNEEIEQLEQENQLLKDRIEKAIEEINYLISNCDLTNYQGEKLKKILKGNSKQCNDYVPHLRWMHVPQNLCWKHRPRR